MSLIRRNGRHGYNLINPYDPNDESYIPYDPNYSHILLISRDYNIFILLYIMPNGDINSHNGYHQLPILTYPINQSIDDNNNTINSTDSDNSIERDRTDTPNTKTLRSPREDIKRLKLEQKIPEIQFGTIIRLKKYYGFIQCAHETYFFYFSSFIGDIRQLKVNDDVEFELAYCVEQNVKRACSIIKIVPENNRLFGIIERLPDGFNELGRISCIRRNEYYYLLFTKKNIDRNESIKVGDLASFQSAQLRRPYPYACHVRKVAALEYNFKDRYSERG